MGQTKAQVSALTAAGDSTKTLVDTITTPLGAKRIIGVWCHALAGAGMTTLEGQSGLFELESSDIALQPLQFPLQPTQIVTSGAVAINIQTWPVNIPLAGQARIAGYVTMDMAITIANKARFGLIYDME